MSIKKPSVANIITLIAILMIVFGVSLQVKALLKGNWFALPPLGLDLVLLYLFMNRKPAKEAVGGWYNWLFALCGTYGPFLIQPTPTSIPALKFLGLAILPIGIAMTFYAISSLGRGFGIIAANREIKTHGAYRFIRHPLYGGEGLWFLAIVLQNFSLFNAILFLLQTSCQIARLNTEERLLKQDEQYQLYLEKVKYRLFPGIY